ncbi:DUF6603 domain-containing protein [Streptomyces sp. FIT100]|uniref:DUF6603 domain-containing protein n=1 Tax=Streptomyces sp. FIT100 TaxID=2837956 RepID=UPI0021C56C25|nr:DUF6603 domain-containing protein [Streptomyces sp. FIT100]UUN30922.1 hypothetical protein KK483_34770 [Streptomyces sp. FIT100]
MSDPQVTNAGRTWVLLGSLDLKDIQLHLPLVDSIIPSGQGIGLNSLELGYSSSPVTDPKQIQKIQDLAGEIKVPEQLGQGGFLLVDLAAGDTSRLLYVPFHSNAAAALPETLGSYYAAGDTSEASDEAATKWWDVDRSLSSVHLSRLGAGYKSGSLLLLADASVGAGGIRLGTKGLGAEVPLKDPAHPKFHLDGLSLEFNHPPLTIAGEFLNLHKPGYDLAVGGAAVIATPAIGVTALGYYGKKTAGDPSLFIFGILDLSKKSVGPPMFRLEKLAAGFGYHTRVRTPKIDEVSQFPFVKMLHEGASDTEPLGQLDKLLQSPDPWVSPQPGTIWLAAGLEALVYELVDVNAVAILQLGRELVVGLYGQASAQFPKAPASPWAKLTVDVRGEYRSSKDVLEIDAQIADGSFVVDRNCTLSGGAAVRVWFGGSGHSGDFVVSVGGYHPRFSVPSHYPVPKRLGFDWHVANNIHIWGKCYAALTPHAFMAGFDASLHAKLGPLNIDCNAYADALIEWDPLHFDVDWGASVHASVWIFSGHVGVSGRIWGPPVGGHAHVDILGYSVDVDFGAGLKAPAPLTPAEFRERLLPGGKPPGAQTYTQADEKNEKVLSVVPVQGLLPSAQPDSQPSLAPAWAFTLESMALSVSTAVPLTSISVNGVDPETAQAPQKENLCIRPLQTAEATSAMTITVQQEGSQSAAVEVQWAAANEETAPSDVWVAKPDNKGVPSALWQWPKADKAELVEGYVSGIVLKPPSPRRTPPILISAEAWSRVSTSIKFANETASKNFSCLQDGTRLPSGTMQALKTGLDATDSVRASALDLLLSKADIPGFDPDPSDPDPIGDLSTFRHDPSAFMDAVPLLLEGRS